MAPQGRCGRSEGEDVQTKCPLGGIVNLEISGTVSSLTSLSFGKKTEGPLPFHIMQKAKYTLKFLLLPLSLRGKEVFR